MDIAQSRTDPLQIFRTIRTTQATPPTSRTRPAITQVAVVSSRGINHTNNKKMSTVASVSVQFFMAYPHTRQRTGEPRVTVANPVQKYSALRCLILSSKHESHFPKANFLL